MKYTYIAAWAIEDGVNLSGAEVAELQAHAAHRIFLSRNPDTFLAPADIYNALGRRALGAFAGADQKSVSECIALVREQRTRALHESTALVVLFDGEADVPTELKIHEVEGHLVVFQTVDPQPLMRRHLREVEAIKLAIALEAQSPTTFALLTGGLYLVNEDGRPIYPVFLAGSGRAISNKGVNADWAAKAAARYQTLGSIQWIKSVGHFYSAMADARDDRIKSFVFGWAALEVVISKLFDEYQHEFMDPLTNAGQPELRAKFVQKLSEAMKNRYKLNDKFLAVTAVLFSQDDANAVEQDVKLFAKIKGVRDSLFHGSTVNPAELPVTEASYLLRKYLAAHTSLPR